MDDLISRQKAIEALRDAENHAFNSYYQGLIKAHKIIADLPTAQPETQWIPCSERLPERADNVIICYKKGYHTLVSTGIYLYKFKMWYVDVVGDLRNEVVAWMPLPEPYKGGDAE